MPRTSTRPRTAAGSGLIAFARAESLGPVPMLSGVGFTGTYRAHVHSVYVIGALEGGGLSVRTPRGARHARRGDLLLLNPFDVHEEAAAGPDGWTFRYFFPGPPALRAAAGLGAPAPDPWFPEPVVADPPLARRLRCIHRVLMGEGIAHHEAAQDALADALRAVVRRHACASARAPEADRGVERARRFLTEEALPPVTLHEVSRMARVSPFHLTRSFAERIGLPPYAFYEQVRVARCRDLLHQGLGLSRIAASAGFTDQSHFTRHFTATTGVTPGKYLNMVRAAGHALSLPTAPAPETPSGARS